jgi:hypothetical protein
MYITNHLFSFLFCKLKINKSIVDKVFFSKYRLSYLIEAYASSEKYWLVCAGLFAKNINSTQLKLLQIFLSSGLLAAAE